MKNLIIKPFKLKGRLEAISSKSYAHRALILASFCKSPTKIYINEYSKDINVTIKALKDLGVCIKKEKSYLIIYPSNKKLENAQIDMYESGSSLRFFTAVSPHFSKNTLIKGQKRLSQRPNKTLIENLRKNGLEIDKDTPPYRISGEFKGGDFSFRKDESSQYISAILLAGSLSGNTFIKLDGSPESLGYIDMTIDVLKKFGVGVDKKKLAYEITNPKLKSPDEYFVEGDWSNAAFFYGANHLGSDINIYNLEENSKQKDKEIVNIIRKIKIAKKEKTGLRIDVSQIPDLAPIVSVLLTTLDKKSAIINGKRLRDKESDRLKSSAKMLNDLGAKAEVIGDSLLVSGKIKGGSIDSFNDHRIVMASSIAGNIADGDIVIKDYEAVNKSYPSFFDNLKSLGADVREL